MPYEPREPALRTDPRRQIAADRHLQLEISKALEGLADNLPGAVDLTLVHILSAVLKPSWTEHVRFQDDALFPMITRRNAHAQDTLALLDRLSAEHAEISERHIEVSEQISLLVAGRPINFQMFGYLLRSTFDCRNRHIETESRIESWLPPAIAPADRALLDGWQASRASPPFPASLLIWRMH